DPAPARRIGAELAHAAAAFERLGGSLDRAVMEAMAVGRETLLVEFGIAVAMRAKAVLGKGALMGVDEAHAIRLAAGGAALPQRDPLHARQEAFPDEVPRPPHQLPVDRERRMNVEAVASARACASVGLEPRVAVGDEDHAAQ